MKKITLFLLLSVVIVLSAEAHKYKNRNAYVTISIQTFYDELSPYGDWIFTSDNGYVWRPYFDYPEAFRPYSSNGNWVYTEYGWTWVSGYNWGWATFHYGRWDFDNFLGWTWIPGYEWAPAWVTWGSYDNYWGWAPMGPDIYVYNNSNWYAPDPWWTFVARNQFCSNNWHNYIYDRPVHVTNITNITNIYIGDNDDNDERHSWYRGPRVSEVESYSRSRVRRVEIADSHRPDHTGISNDRLNVYRPVVENRRSESRPAEYRSVENARNTRRIEQSNARTNDPGVNRTRENRSESRVGNQVPANRNENRTVDTRVERRTSQIPAARNAVGSGNSRGNNGRPDVQTETRRDQTNNQTREVKRVNSSAPTQRSSGKPANAARTEVNEQTRNGQTRNETRSTAGSAGVSRPESRQPNSNTAVRENAGRSAQQETRNRQSSSTQPTREIRTQNAAPAVSQDSRNTERKEASKAEVKQETRNSSDNQVRKTSGNPSRR